MPKTQTPCSKRGVLITFPKRPAPVSEERLSTIYGLWNALRTLIDETHADLSKGAGYQGTNWRLVTRAQDFPPPVVILNSSNRGAS